MLLCSTVFLTQRYLRKILQVIFYNCPLLVGIPWGVFDYCLLQTMLQFTNLIFLALKKMYLICKAVFKGCLFVM